MMVPVMLNGEAHCIQAICVECALSNLLCFQANGAAPLYLE